MRIVYFLVCWILAAAVVPSYAEAQRPAIELPALMAVELPPGATTVSATDPAMAKVLGLAKCPGYEVRAELAHSSIGPGAARVVWTASRPGTHDAVAQRAGAVFVRRHGTVPVGLSGDDNATTGNNASHIVRNPDGFIHMVWQDSWRPGKPNEAFYRRAEVTPAGQVRFDTEPTPLTPTGGEWNAYPSLAAAGQTVYFVWQQPGTVHYRTLRRLHDAGQWSNPVDLHAPLSGHDVGPVIDLAAGVLHVVTPSGYYLVSTDDGKTWKTSRIPIPDHTTIKTDSLSADTKGGAWISMSLMFPSVPELSDKRGSGAYWELRVIHWTADGQWSALEDPLAKLPEWGPPKSHSEDVLVDWTRIALDATGGIHLMFHGTAVSRIYGNDRSYYLWRDAGGAWHEPVILREPVPGAGKNFSYAPSIALAGDVALPLTFYDVSSGAKWVGFDSILRQFRNGEAIGSPLPVTQYSKEAIAAGDPESALGSRFPEAAPPRVYGSERASGDGCAGGAGARNIRSE